MAEENTGTDNQNRDTENGNRGQLFTFNCALSAGCCLLSILFMAFCIISILSAG